MTPNSMEQPTWNHPEGERDVVKHDRFEDGVILRGLAIAIGTIVVLSFALWAVIKLANVGSVSESLASFATCTPFFVGFALAGGYVASKSTRDRFLQVTALVVLGFVAAAIGTALDLIGGFWLGNLMPGQDANDAAQVHLGFWVVSWVAIPAAAFVAASVVPRGGQDWGTQYSEPEDTQI